MEIKSMFVIPNEVVESEVFKNYKVTTKLVYLYLLKVTNQSADKEGWIHVQSVALARLSGIGVDPIRRAKQQLLEDGYIEVKDCCEQETNDPRRCSWIRVKDWQSILKALDQAEEKQLKGGYFA